MRKGKVIITYEALRDFFHLSDNIRVTRMREDFNRNCIELIVEGPSMPEVRDGEMIPVVSLDINQLRVSLRNEFEF